MKSRAPLALERLQRQGAWLASRPRWLIVVVVAVLTIGRTGFHWYQTDWDIQRNQISAFPEALTWQASSWGNLTIGRLLGISEPWQWYVPHAALTAALFIIPLVAMKSMSRRNFAFFAGFWALMPIWSTLMMWIGLYDVLTVAGAAVIALSKRLWATALGAVLMSSGNPEQAILACGAYLLLSLTPSFRSRRTHALLASVISIVLYAPVHLWFASQDAMARGEHLRSIRDGLLYLVNGWPSSVFWWFGVLWILVGIYVIIQSRWHIVAAVAALIVIPAAAVVVTHDGDRVFWLVSSVTTIALVQLFSDKARSLPHSEALLPVVLGLLVIFPSPNGSLFFVVSNLGGVARSIFGAS